MVRAKVCFYSCESAVEQFNSHPTISGSRISCLYFWCSAFLCQPFWSVQPWLSTTQWQHNPSAPVGYGEGHMMFFFKSKSCFYFFLKKKTWRDSNGVQIVIRHDNIWVFYTWLVATWCFLTRAKPILSPKIRPPWSSCCVSCLARRPKWKNTLWRQTLSKQRQWDLFAAPYHPLPAFLQLFYRLSLYINDNFPSTFSQYFVPMGVAPKSNFIITFICFYVYQCFCWVVLNWRIQRHE